MYYVKDHWTENLFDPWEHLGPRRRKILDAGWAGLFRTHLLRQLPVEQLARKFKEYRGRPTKELFVMLGGTVLQHLFDLTDTEAREAILFRVDWQYALDITDPSDAQLYVSDRTWRSYRKQCVEIELDLLVFEKLTDTLREAFGVDTANQRLDSTHLVSNMRTMGRTRLFVTTIKKFLKKLVRLRKADYATLPPELIERYMGRDADACFSRMKPSEAGRTLNRAAEDMAVLVEHFRPIDGIRKWEEYQLLERVLDEQCTVTGMGRERQVTVKPANTVSPDCLQNPSDPDAAYNKHKGSGYQAQIMETYQPGETRDPTKPNLVTYVKVEPADRQDMAALHPALDATEERNCRPTRLLADTHYGSDENKKTAKERGVELVAPVGGVTTQKGLILGTFEADPVTGLVTRCPEGHSPEKVTRTEKNRVCAFFPLAVCRVCPRQQDCPVTLNKKKAVLRYPEARFRCARRRVEDDTREFWDVYRWRAGIEGCNSHLKRDTGADCLRVRGLDPVRFVVTLKVLGLNIMRCAHALTARVAAGLPPLSRIQSVLLRPISAFFAVLSARHIPFTGYHENGALCA
jgi:hypothetical protein